MKCETSSQTSQRTSMSSSTLTETPRINDEEVYLVKFIYIILPKKCNKLYNHLKMTINNVTKRTSHRTYGTKKVNFMEACLLNWPFLMAVTIKIEKNRKLRKFKLSNHNRASETDGSRQTWQPKGKWCHFSLQKTRQHYIFRKDTKKQQILRTRWK